VIEHFVLPTKNRFHALPEVLFPTLHCSLKVAVGNAPLHQVQHGRAVLVVEVHRELGEMILRPRLEAPLLHDLFVEVLHARLIITFTVFAVDGILTTSTLEPVTAPRNMLNVEPRSREICK
jgi:hypothetical protein